MILLADRISFFHEKVCSTPIIWYENRDPARLLLGQSDRYEAKKILFRVSLQTCRLISEKNTISVPYFQALVTLGVSGTAPVIRSHATSASDNFPAFAIVQSQYNRLQLERDVMPTRQLKKIEKYQRCRNMSRNESRFSVWGARSRLAAPPSMLAKRISCPARTYFCALLSARRP